MANTVRDAGRETFWRAALKRQASSGLSVRAFCRQENLAESNFYAWRRTIAGRDAEARNRRRKKPKRSKAPAFLPAVVTGEPPLDAGIVLELAGGRRLRLPESTTAERLAAIVHALECEAVL